MTCIKYKNMAILTESSLKQHKHTLPQCIYFNFICQRNIKSEGQCGPYNGHIYIKYMDPFQISGVLRSRNGHSWSR